MCDPGGPVLASKWRPMSDVSWYSQTANYFKHAFACKLHCLLLQQNLLTSFSLSLSLFLQDDLKESDRVLLDIFKQLECNVAELNDSISLWRSGGGNSVSSPGRPISFTDLDFGTSRSSYCGNPPPVLNGGLETILDSSKEDISYKASHESDSLYLPENEESSLSCSPVLRSLKSHASIPSISSGGSNSSSGAAKRPHNPSPPQLTTSTSFTNHLASSPSISRLQDETGSNISRNSSIDSGIQFASEAENGSTNGGVEPMNQGVEPPAAAAAAPPSLLAKPSSGKDGSDDVRKSVGFADDIFAALGL